MLRLILAFLLAGVLVAPVSAAGKQPCYGLKEQALARELLQIMPGLVLKFRTEKQWFRQMRDQVCGTRRYKGRQLVNVGAFYGDRDLRALIVAAEARKLDALPVAMAMHDLLDVKNPT